jgi:hypothetical protein
MQMLMKKKSKKESREKKRKSNFLTDTVQDKKKDEMPADNFTIQIDSSEVDKNSFGKEGDINTNILPKENEVQIIDNYPQNKIKIDDLNNEKFKDKNIFILIIKLLF